MPSGITIVRWPQRQPDNLDPNSCGPNGCCPDNSTGLFNRNRQPIIPRQQQPNQQQPYQSPTPLPPVVPSFGEPWPGINSEPEQILPEQDESKEVPLVEVSPSAQLKDIANKYDALEKENEEQKEKIVALETTLNDGMIAQTTSVIKNNPWWSTLFAGIGGGILYFLWNLFIRKILVRKIDSVEDLLQEKIAKKWGTEAASNVRGIMDGVDEMLMGTADTFLERRRLVSRLNKNASDTAINNEKRTASKILQVFKDSIKKEQNKFLASQVLSKQELTDLLKESEKTEIAEKDETGQAALKEVMAKLDKLTDTVSVLDAKSIIDQIKSIEGKDNDASVVAMWEKLEEKIQNIDKKIDAQTK
jgi:hypothetical protein